MQVSEQFQTSLKNMLDRKSVVNETFAAFYKNPEKNIEECCKYIIQQVQKTERCGFDDQEIISIAVDYYEAKEVDVSNCPDCKVIVNQKVELTEEEMESLRQKARDDFYNEAKRKMSTQSAPKKPVAPKVEEPQLDLFSMLGDESTN